MAASTMLVRTLAQQDKRLNAMERAQKLRHSAVPDLMPIYDAQGRLRMTVGQMGDGTYAIETTDGLKPPKPSKPVLVPEPKGMTIVWTGRTAVAAGEEEGGELPPDGSGSWEQPWTDPVTEPQYWDPRYASYDGNPPIIDWDDFPTDLSGFEDPVDPPPLPDDEFNHPDGLWPADLDHIEIHVSRLLTEAANPAFECTDATQVGTFTTAARTMTKTVLGLLAEGRYSVRLVAVSRAKKESRPSDPVVVVALKDPLVAAQSAMDKAVEALEQAVEAIAIGELANGIYDGETPPAPPEGKSFNVNDLWIRDSDKRMHLWSGSEWVAIPDSGIQAAYDAAADAAAAAAAAAAIGTNALESANGRNKNRTENFAPTNEPNTAGDNWWVVDGNGDIVQQWQGQGGTAWTQRQLSSAAFAYVDVGKLVAGTGLVNAFTVKTNLTLGDASTNGVIQSYNYAGSTTGVVISKSGITAKGGTITGATVSGGNATLDANGLTIYGSGGAAVLYTSGGSLYLTGGIMSGGQLTGSALLITGAGGIQTDSRSNYGLKINSNGILAYPGTGSSVPSFSLVAATGAVTMLGELLTGSKITGADITGSTFKTSGGAFWNTELGSGGLYIRESGSSPDSYYFTAQAGIYTRQLTTRYGATITGTLTAETLDVNGTGFFTTVSTDHVVTDTINVNGSLTLAFGGGTINALATINNGGNDITINAPIRPREAYLTNVPVNSGGESIYMSTTGRLYARVAPSRIEWKRDVETIDVDPDALAEVAPITFRYTDDVPLELEDPDEVHWGLPYDDVMLHGVHQLAGTSRDMDVVRPERLPLVLLAAWRKDRARVNAELADLRAEVETLRAAA